MMTPHTVEQRRSARLAELIRDLAIANRPLTPTMSDVRFRAMIERMAEHQLLYEEYGRDDR